MVGVRTRTIFKYNNNNNNNNNNYYYKKKKTKQKIAKLWVTLGNSLMLGTHRENPDFKNSDRCGSDDNNRNNLLLNAAHSPECTQMRFT